VREGEVGGEEKNQTAQTGGRGKLFPLSVREGTVSATRLSSALKTTRGNIRLNSVRMRGYSVHRIDRGPDIAKEPRGNQESEERQRSGKEDGSGPKAPKKKGKRKKTQRVPSGEDTIKRKPKKEYSPKKEEVLKPGSKRG